MGSKLLPVEGYVEGIFTAASSLVVALDGLFQLVGCVTVSSSNFLRGTV
jgi:hypothetical protein